MLLLSLLAGFRAKGPKENFSNWNKHEQKQYIYIHIYITGMKHVATVSELFLYFFSYFFPIFFSQNHLLLYTCFVLASLVTIFPGQESEQKKKTAPNPLRRNLNLPLLGIVLRLHFYGIKIKKWILIVFFSLLLLLFLLFYFNFLSCYLYFFFLLWASFVFSFHVAYLTFFIFLFFPLQFL